MITDQENKQFVPSVDSALVQDTIGYINKENVAVTFPSTKDGEKYAKELEKNGSAVV